MRNALIVTSLLALTLSVVGCGAEPEPASPAPSSVSTTATAEQAAQESTTSAAQAQPSGELKVMTAEDMEKLQKDRKQQIDRSTPLGEEKDPVKDLQKSKSEGGGSD